MTKSQINYSALLTPEIEAQMPKGLTGVDAMNWRKRKMKELVEQGYTGIDGNVPRFEDTAKTSESTESAEMTETTDVEMVESTESTEVAEMHFQNGNEESGSDDEFEAENYEQPNESTENLANDDVLDAEILESKADDTAVFEKKQTKKVASNRVFSRGSNQTKATSSSYEDVRSVHKSVMAAMRKSLPGTASKADLLAAFVYIHTDGDCEISDNAMQIVKAYKAEDKQFDLTQRTETRLANIERMLREQRDMIQSVELCTCYNTFDRRYGSKEPRRAPKDTEFREQGNLDMLARLRKQAKDQRMIDDVEKGRAIYNQTKDKND